MDATSYQPLEKKVHDNNIKIGNSTIYCNNESKIILERCIRTSRNKDSYAIRMTMPWKKHYIINNTKTSKYRTSLKQFEAYSNLLERILLWGGAIYLNEKDSLAILMPSPRTNSIDILRKNSKK